MIKYEYDYGMNEIAYSVPRNIGCVVNRGVRKRRKNHV